MGATAEPDNNGGADETSILPRQYTEEEKISLAVTRLAQNEKLLGALAWRLGIPLANVRPDGREPALARARGDESNDEEGRTGGGSEDDEELEENRWQIEVFINRGEGRSALFFRTLGGRVYLRRGAD